MTRDELISLARLTAAAHGLPPDLVCAQIERESEWNPWAIRFEPGFEARYVEPREGAEHMTVTEAYARGFSWGLGQVLGEVAREFGFRGEFLSELSDPATGIEFQCRKLAKCLKDANGNVVKALETYNGGARPQYASEVLALAAPYRFINSNCFTIDFGWGL
jgi:soluble lytic murein transglycosylase-like protein